MPKVRSSTTGINEQRFFSPVKKKVARESHFRPFCPFFHGQFFIFTGTFLPFFKIFHAQLFFFTGNFIVFGGFFTGKKSLSRATILIFFHGKFLFFAIFIFLRVNFQGKNFTGNFCFFTDIFSSFFHGHVFFSRAKFWVFSRGRFWFSRGKKKHC